MTREDVIEALKNNVKIINEDGLERDINWFLGSIDYSSWKIKPRTVASQPKPPLLSDAEINKSFPGGFRTDEYESGFYDGAKWAESKVYLCSKPIHKPLTNDEIDNIQSKIPDWDDHEYGLSFARAIEAKVRSQYEN